MRFLRRVLAALAATGAVLATSFASAGTAHALPPSNDTIAGATVITGLPFADTVDTTDATTDANELAVAQPCIDIGAPAIEKAVWYTGTSTTSETVVIDVTGSDYSAGIAVYNGPPSASTFVTCAPGIIIGPASPGTTFYIMVFGDEPGSAGGQLNISIEVAPPPPTVSVWIDSIGRVDPKTGTARLTGTLTCEGDAEFVELFGELRQRAGRVIISGFVEFSEDGSVCDGTPIPLTLDVVGSNGRFAGGKAHLEAFAFVCGPFDCTEMPIEQDIRLRGGLR